MLLLVPFVGPCTSHSPAMPLSQDAALVRTMRPLLNRWLGGFGDALTSGAGEDFP